MFETLINRLAKRNSSSLRGIHSVDEAVFRPIIMETVKVSLQKIQSEWAKGISSFNLLPTDGYELTWNWFVTSVVANATSVFCSRTCGRWSHERPRGRRDQSRGSSPDTTVEEMPRVKLRRWNWLSWGRECDWSRWKLSENGGLVMPCIMCTWRSRQWR